MRVELHSVNELVKSVATLSSDRSHSIANHPTGNVPEPDGQHTSSELPLLAVCEFQRPMWASGDLLLVGYDAVVNMARATIIPSSDEPGRLMCATGAPARPAPLRPTIPDPRRATTGTTW